MHIRIGIYASRESSHCSTAFRDIIRRHRREHTRCVSVRSLSFARLVRDTSIYSVSEANTKTYVTESGMRDQNEIGISSDILIALNEVVDDHSRSAARREAISGTVARNSINMHDDRSRVRYFRTHQISVLSPHGSRIRASCLSVA